MKNPPSQPDFDFNGIIGDLSKAFNPLHDECLVDYHVSEVREGYVYLSIAMPVGMSRVFVGLLGSLEGFFKIVDRRVRITAAETKSIEPNQVEKRENFKNDFHKAVFYHFDSFIDQGLEPKEAVKRTNKALKDAEHPWATYDVVRTILSASGRLKKQKG